MVQRAACNSETSASLNGARNGDREGETSGVVIATDAVDIGPRGVVTSDVGECAPLTRGSGRFSLFRWFKRNRDSNVEKQQRTDSARPNDDDNIVRRRRSSVYSSVESVDTFYSTTTVHSFAFHAGTLGRCDVLSLDILKQATEVGPFAAGASKVSVGDKENIAAVASTLPTNAHSRRRDITARYSLHPSTTFGSCDNFPTPGANLSRRHDERARVTYNGSTRRRVHVKGKRKAPNPPGAVVKVAEVDARETTARNSSGRRKRRAPRPPLDNRPAEEQSRLVTDGGGDMEIEERMRNADERQSISNDTLVLQDGMLLSKKEVCNRELSKSARNDDAGASGAAILPERAHSPIGTLSAAMPRPWYKRSVFEHSRDSGPSSKRGAVFRGSVESTKEETCVGANLTTAGTNYSVDASLSRLNFFHRAERQSDDRKRQEVKRKSGLSILTNISELDKEAAAIVQEEQARTRASMLLKTSQFADAFEKSNDANEEIVQDIVASAMESSSPRRGTRALISKFNAISNITKVTVNANFFARRDQPGGRLDRDAARSSRFEQGIGDWGNQRARRDLGQNVVRVDKDISRYFLPQQRPSRGKSEAARADAKPTDIKITIKEQNDQLMQDASDRISLLQSQLAANRANETRKDVILPVTEEKIRSRQEIGGERKGKETARLNSEISRRFLLSRARNLAESTEHALDLYRGRAERGGERPEGTRKEFSDIFDEIDRQLRSREFKLIERRPAVESDSGGRATKVPEDEAASSKVAKVLDILVEAEKDGKTRSAIQSARSIPSGESSHLIDSDQKAKSCKTKSTVLNTVEDPITADLKEMLKEMKHSLPKRPKPRKVTSNDDDEVLEKVEKRSPVSANKTYVASVTSTDAAPPNDYEADKQKVSSSVQTSGNIRRLNQPSAAAERPSTSGWRHENVLYRTSGKGSALVKNTFQLIRPRDFAEIEAMKTTREVYKENTYANVIEPSLYANAHVPPASPKQRPDPTRSKDIPQSSNAKVPPNIAIENKIALNEDEFSEEDDNSKDRNMNTLAINRLLRKLEGAIASGHHHQAAGLAKELAKLKIHCSVIQQQSAARLKDQSIKVNMYIEDKLAHQGPIPLQLPKGMTVAELKTKIYTEFEIPTNVQRWIIGKNLVNRDDVTLNELHTMDGLPVFLYLVAPDMPVDNATQAGKAQIAEDKVPEDSPQDPPQKAKALQTIEEDPKEKIIERENVALTANEDQRETVEIDVSEDVKMGRYEELILLENWDVIPNSEPIECPICFVTYGPREGVILKDCLHMFCRPCIANTIAYCEEAEVKCPYRDADYMCESTLQEREIKALVEPEVYQQHLAKSIAQAENNAGNKAFHCKTPDCPGWCIYDDDVNNFLCPVCGANNCLTCRVIHTGKNCRQYQELSQKTDQESKSTAAMLKEMVDRGEALACPTCAVVLMKKWGCDWLVCSMCKTEICWVTRGPRWGPRGKGDTSGGCKCGENGVKCHPRCNYCH